MTGLLARAGLGLAALAVVVDRFVTKRVSRWTPLLGPDDYLSCIVAWPTDLNEGFVTPSRRHRSKSPSLPSLGAVAVAVAVVVSALSSSSAFAQGPAPAAPPPAASATTSSAPEQPLILEGQVPTYMDVVKRGLRTRLDLGGRYGTVGLPDPPVRLEVDDVVADRNDIDIGGSVIVGYDRPFGVPMAADLMADFNADANPDSPVSPYLDDTSRYPRLRLYSAFIGLSAGPAEPSLQPFKINLGRMTQLAESPITYDGASLGANFAFKGLGYFNAKLWGGLDAPQRLSDDPFSRTSRRFYGETYAVDGTFTSNPGAYVVTRTALNASVFNPVAGLNLDGRFYGFGVLLTHTLTPAQTLWVNDVDNTKDVILPLQRSKLGVSYRVDSDWLMATVGLDTQATDLLPRNLTLKGDALTMDGTTRVGVVGRLQFLEDITVYDGTFRAFNPAQTFDRVAADEQEQLRVRDQIRHLNFGPPQEHIYGSAEFERQLPGSFAVLLRGRLRQHFDAADVDMFRSNLYEIGGGVTWNPGFAFDAGLDVYGGLVDSGLQNGLAYDLNAEGLSSYLEPRAWVKSTLLEGKLSNLTEVFVRRSDVQTKRLIASGQWGGALATTTRYDIHDSWQVSLRLDGDALAPIDSLNASYYLGALAATTVRF